MLVGPQPPATETYVRYDILEQVWEEWNDFLLRNVGINPRQGRPVVMVRSQPIVNVLALPHWARMPTSYISAIRLTHYGPGVSIANIDHFNAYGAFIKQNAFRREKSEDMCILPVELNDRIAEVETVVRRRANW